MGKLYINICTKTLVQEKYHVYFRGPFKPLSYTIQIRAFSLREGLPKYVQNETTKNVKIVAESLGRVHNALF